MTLQTPQPPPSALRAVLAALTSDAALRQSGAGPLRSPTGPLLPAHPLAVHQLPPGAGTTRALDSAPRTGWRFLIKHGGEVVAAAEVVRAAEGHTFSHFAAGPYLDSTVQALAQAWQLAHPLRSRHQPRLLSMPGHYATALWLHSTDTAPDGDLLIPLAPAPLGVTAHRAYPAAELLALLARPTTTTVAAAAPLAAVPAF
ncbi:hypothetical protein P3T36_007124 [Kitasatospora sp. MAP12-15]|uniref:hypothetical protein n=1 Tax=unclassified Kitasatospora TaxID=2633591 RepID=UPI002476762B|nr:hypothetical protein [Kitasatospora sp. MAP12-44]MDH6109005.1 hypothetical protein [Kitasatospora sp. MAP12-44]